jgi:hypothetical protein
VRSSREAAASPAGAGVPVAPWSEPEVGGRSNIERGPGVAIGAGWHSAAVAPLVRMGFGLLDDEPDGLPDPSVEADPRRSEPPNDDSTKQADDLWSLYLAGPSPLYENFGGGADATVRSAGMWVEPFHSEPALPPPQRPLTARHRNSRSVRHRPWGPVPGRDDALVSGLRVPDRIRRPRS